MIGIEVVVGLVGSGGEAKTFGAGGGGNDRDNASVQTCSNVGNCGL